jgi:phosphoglycerate dehydrogenase-like enzyme
MMKCAILNDYQRVALGFADWSVLDGRLEIVVFDHAFASPDDTVSALEGFDVLVVMRERTWLGVDVLERLPNLKLIVTGGMRNAAIDLAAAARRGIVVSGTEMPSIATSELVWALLLSLLRHLPVETANLRAGGRWQLTVGRELSGSRLGIVGLGRLGTPVSKVALAFGMTVSAWSRNLTAERCAAVGVEHAGSLEALLESADAVTIHVPLTAASRGLIGRNEVARMKRSALLINTSRGPIVDEAALVEALETGGIAGAGLDVFDVEPLPQGHPFRRLPNVVATPHLGYVTEETFRAYYGRAIEGIEAWLAGTPVRRLTPV